MSELITGTVKFFNNKKGYGMIKGADNIDYFAHYSNIYANGYKKLLPKQIVEFEPFVGEKGALAKKIRRLSP